MKIARLIGILALFLAFAPQVFSQKNLLQSGPMLGYSEMMEAMLWVQTNAPAEVQFAYWEEGGWDAKKYTDTKQTVHHEAYTAHLVADQVLPGKWYGYELMINGQPVELSHRMRFQTQTLWQWRTDPPAFKMALGSCTYVNETEYDRPGNPYGGDYQIFKSIHAQQPDLMLWLGDNVYLREVDWFTRTGFLHRYTHTRSLPEMQPLLANTHHYAIWDDHDYGPNDSDRSFVHKEMAREVFQLFWGNPTYGLPGNGGITTAFQWADCDFFMMDDRSFRNPNHRTSGEQAYLGTAQLEWLVDALVASKGAFKFVAIGGQTLTTVAKYENYVALCPEERTYLLKRISEEGVKNVVFLTGDSHHTELSHLVNSAGNSVYDFTVSPLTSGVYKMDGTNMLQVEGTLVEERNFGTIEVSGPRKERQLTMRIFNSNGEQLWEKVIAAQ